MSDKIIYENKTNLKKSILLYGYKIYLKKFIIHRVVKIFYIIIALVYTLNFIVKKNHFGVVCQLIFTLLILFDYKIFYFIISKVKKYSLNLERTYRFYDDRLEVTTDINKLILKYDRIKIAFENDEAFYMIFEKQLICIDKSGFTIGNAVHFDNFIKNRIKFR